MKEQIKQLTPHWLLQMYHRMLSILSNRYFRTPSRKLFVIGVTGTNGKSTVVQMIGHILRSSGVSVAWISTATESIRDGVTLNARKMTTPGHGALQHFMRRALTAGCTHAVLEVSSQGLAQKRHEGIAFDVGVFLNLTPEHIEAHGSFERYRDAKLTLFRYMSSRRYEKFGKPQQRIGIVNMDDTQGPNFMTPYLEQYIGFGIETEFFSGLNHLFRATQVQRETSGRWSFVVEGIPCHLPLYGKFNVLNALAALSAAHTAGVSLPDAVKALQSFVGVPGRLEFVYRGAFDVLVDYAPEPASMEALYSVINDIPHKRIIHVFGSAGGGRDKARRSVLGTIVGTQADIAIVTNEDPYDEDPQAIINQVAQGVLTVGRLHQGESLYLIEDRRRAIQKAIALAGEGDLVVLTGKACEQWIMGPKGSKIPWDDRQVAREELYKKGYLSTENVDK